MDVRWQATLDNQGYTVFKNVGLDAAKNIRIEATIFIKTEKPEFIPFRVVEEKDSDPRIRGSSITLRGVRTHLARAKSLGFPPFQWLHSISPVRSEKNAIGG